ncbi:MAG: hypothetical protein RLY64_915 [Bacteroidota bacterium]|jgi:hypothetical protein
MLDQFGVHNHLLKIAPSSLLLSLLEKRQRITSSKRIEKQSPHLNFTYWIEHFAASHGQRNAEHQEYKA